MGVTLEQYRARIGAHNNVVVKKYSTGLHVCPLFISTLLFQLVIMIIILIIFVPACHSNIFYLSQNSLIEHTIKHSSKVIALCTQISGYIVYVPLLLIMANDIEVNSGPTIYDVVDPSKTICADFSQGNTKKFRQNAGKQCVAMSLTAIVYDHITNVNAWDTALLNDILCTGNNLYTFISNSVNKSYLLLTDVPEVVSVFDNIYHLKYSDPFAGDLFMSSPTPPYYSLESALNNLFEDTEFNYSHCLLTIDCNTVAIFKTSQGNFKIFDSHSRDLYGMPHPFGKCVLVSIEAINNLLIYFQNTVPQCNVTPFELKAVNVQLNSEIIQNVMFGQETNANKSLPKTKRPLENARESKK